MDFWIRSRREERKNVPIWIFVGFQQRNRQNSQILNTVTFYRPSVTSAQCLIGIEKYPDNSIWLNFEDDDYSQGYGQIEAFRTLAEDDFLKPCISDNAFRSSNNNIDNGYNLYVFDIR